ncbi:hypothetical protein ACP6PM_30920 [Dapis sp. BLCC M229]
MLVYDDRFTINYFVNSIGSCIAQERIEINGKFRAIACGEGALVKQKIYYISSNSHYNTLCNIDKQIIEAVKTSIRQLETKSLGWWCIVMVKEASGV